MVSVNWVTIIAAVAVTIVAIGIPAYLARRIDTGEARFDKDGKLIDDE